MRGEASARLRNIPAAAWYVPNTAEIPGCTLQTLGGCGDIWYAITMQYNPVRTELLKAEHSMLSWRPATVLPRYLKGAEMYYRIVNEGRFLMTLSVRFGLQHKLLQANHERVHSLFSICRFPISWVHRS